MLRALALILATVFALATGCGGGPAETAATRTGAAIGPAGTPTATPVPMRLLKTTPEKGPVGTKFTIRGQNLPAGKTVDVLWGSLTGSYDTELTNNRWVLHKRNVVSVRHLLGQTRVDDEGNLLADFEVPEDYGEIHDIYVAADGADIAKGGFFVTRDFSVSTDSGPVGAPIAITVTGLSLGALNSTMALRYDNKYTGWISATTTRGTAVARIRAAGPVGEHLIELIPASHLTPYMNVEQSSVGYLKSFRTWFTVTDDNTRPPQTLDKPTHEISETASIQKTTVGLVPIAAPLAQATLSPARGPVGSKVDINVSGLTPGVPVSLVWGTVTGSDTFGWNLFEESLGNATVAQDGTLKASGEIPGALGGWHAVWIKQGNEVLTETPFFVQRSLTEVTPEVVRQGETVTVRVNGLGWNELDNGAAITYDNGFIGYACGFSSNGDVVFDVTATGGPGVHLIDLYPMIYDSGTSKWPWQANMPHLSALEDHPGLSLGYSLPIFRLAIEIVE